MLGHLVRKEILDQILSLRFLILSGIGALIIWLSLYDGYAYYQARLKDYRLAQAATEQRMQQIAAAEGLVREPWYELNNFGFSESKAPTVMSVFIRGLEPTLGRSISNVSVPQAQRLRKSPVETEPILGIFPALDLGLVVQVVLSLFVLLLAYDAVCGEKEGGALRLTASFPVPRHRILLGKFLGVFLPALTAFGLPTLIGITVVLQMPDVQIAGPEWVRLSFILVAFGLYLAAFACAGLLASCLTHRSATSFVLLLTFWVATVVVAPRLSLIVATGIRPAPSIHEHQAKAKAISLQDLSKWRELRTRWQQEHAQPGQEFWRTPEGQEAERLNYMKTRKEVYGKSDPELARLDEAFRNRYNARMNLGVILARLSPAFAFKNAAIRLAGTGIDRHQRFERAFTGNYVERYQNWFDKTSDLDILRRIHPAKYGKREWQISDMPRLAYREIWPEEDLQAALVDVGMLVLWGVVFFAWAYVAMLRYDLR